MIKLEESCRKPMLHGHDNVEMDTTRGKFLKIHMTRMFDTGVGHVSDTTWLHDRSVCAT